MKKFIIALLSLFVLTGCSTPNEAIAQELTVSEPAVVEVTDITTNNPVIEIGTESVWVLQYTIFPVNATDKSVTIDTTNSNNVVEVNKDVDTGAIVAVGKMAGTGVVSLVTNNGKFVSYSITVLPPIPPEPEKPLVYKEDDILKYYNNRVPEDMKIVDYVDRLDYKGWQGLYIYDTSIDDSKESLQEPVDYIKQYLPIFTKYIYDEEGNATPDGFLYTYANRYRAKTIEYDAYYVYVGVSSNFFAAVSVFSYIVDEYLVLDVCIYDGRNNVYTALN